MKFIVLISDQSKITYFFGVQNLPNIFVEIIARTVKSIIAKKTFRLHTQVKN